MSKRKILMKRRINQAVRAGRTPDVVIPKNMKRASLKKLFD